MGETAAHLVVQVFPQVQVRQGVLSLPRRLRYFLHHEAGLVNPVLRIFLAEVEATLRSCSPDAPDDARFETITFVHRFGSSDHPRAPRFLDAHRLTVAHPKRSITKMGN